MVLISRPEVESQRAAVGQTLTMTCQITRPVAGTVDEYGEPAITWSTFATGVPCYAWERSGTERLGAVSAHEFGLVHVKMRADQDVTEHDLVENIVTPTDDGDELPFPSPLRIIAVHRRPTHTLLRCQRLEGQAEGGIA